MTDSEAQRERDAPLDISPDAFRAAGHQLIDRIADFLGSLPSRRVTPGESLSVVREALGATEPMPAAGTDPTLLLEQAATLVFEHSLFNGRPRFCGYITSSAAPIGALGDRLPAAVNPNVGPRTPSPIASEIEAQSFRWIADLIGFPSD